MFFVLIIAIMISELGAGLVQISVYDIISNNNAGPEYYILTSIAFLLPAAIVSGFVPALIVLIGEGNIAMLATFALIVSYLLNFVLGGYNYALPTVAVEAVSAIYGISIYPSVQKIVKSMSLSDWRTALFAKTESIMGPSSAAIGMGIGTFCDKLLGSKNYYLACLIAATASSVFIVFQIIMACKVNPQHKSSNNISLEEFHDVLPSVERQKILQRAQTLPSILAILTIPFSTITPYISVQKDWTISEISNFSILSEVLVAKTLGQILGPLLSSVRTINFILSNKHALAVLSFLFFVFYFLSIRIGASLSTLVMIMLAHMISSLMSTAAFFGLQRHSSEGEIATRSAIQIKEMLISSIIVSVLSLLLFNMFGLNGILIVTSLAFFLLFRLA